MPNYQGRETKQIFIAPREGQTIVIDNEIEVEVLSIAKDYVKLHITSPKTATINKGVKTMPLSKDQKKRNKTQEKIYKQIAKEAKRVFYLSMTMNSDPSESAVSTEFIRQCAIQATVDSILTLYPAKGPEILRTLFPNTARLEDMIVDMTDERT